MSSKPLTWLQKAQKCQSAGQNAEAWEAYRSFLKVQPSHAGAWADMGGLLMNMDRLPEALEACNKALKLDPGLPYAKVNLACTRMKMGQLQEAERLLRRILTKEPRRIEALLALGESLIRQDRWLEALPFLEQVTEQEPTNLLAFQKIIYLQTRRGDWQAQYTEIHRRLQLVPDCPEALMELSVLDLLRGVMPQGWDEYECRFRLASQVVSVVGPFSQPRWEGQPFPGKTLLLHWEQGFGDTLMFIRYAALAKERGGKVIVQAQPILADLLATCPGVEEVVRHGDPLPPFDFHLPVMSLARVFRTTVDSIPSSVPYLDVPSHVPNRQGIANVLAASNGRLRIGYAWAGRAEFKNDHQRSIPLHYLSPLSQLPGVAWHSFQVPAIEPTPMPSVSLGRILSNFSDTAYALSGMDLVITVDTALAHAAGALGIPVFLMVAFEPDWRWLLDRSDSPWYPTLRIYRQPAPGDWASVVQAILQDLSQD